ncbi:MAG: asparaginase [Bacteroidia bacterium]|nr:asparaginase [Bacteroidia bacterium]
MNRKSQRKKNILLIYTGGTIGMIHHPQTGALTPINFRKIIRYVPELSRLEVQIDTHSLREPIDSSDMHPSVWVELVELIEKNYHHYNGFVILHGSDTMSYTASALSFLLENIKKPVILTGSQLPLGTLRTDGKENLITSIEISCAEEKPGVPMVQEVCIYFEYKLFRGNRTFKFNSEHFNAFYSPNFPVLAEAGLQIQYNRHLLLRPKGKIRFHKKLENDIMIFRIFPGMSRKITESILGIKGLKALVLVTYGSGNAPQLEWFKNFIHELILRGVLVVNVTQCKMGRVDQTKYQTGIHLFKAGVIGAEDMTLEAAVTKLMFLLANVNQKEIIKRKFVTDLRGELSKK